MSPVDRQLYDKMQACNDHYGAMLYFMKNLYHDLPRLSAMAIREHLRNLDQMQEQAQKLDGELRRLVQQTGLEAIPEDLLKARTQLVKDVQRINGLLVDMLEGKIALVENDLRRNQRCQSAMNGYRQPRQRGSKLVHVNF